MKMSIIENEDRKTVVTILWTKLGKFVGKAKCDDEDEYDLDIGCNISEARALIKLSRAKERDYKKKAESLIKQANKMTERLLFQRLHTEELEDDLEERLMSYEEELHGIIVDRYVEEMEEELVAIN